MKMKSYVISTGSTTINGRDMVKDSAGVLHCVYSKYYNTRYNIYHGWSADGGKTWQEEQVTFDPRTGGHNNINPAIDVDSNDNLHVVWKYCDISASVGTTIKYAKYDGTSWTITSPLLYTAYSIGYATIAIDGNNHIHVTCNGSIDITGNGQILYMVFDGSSWSGELYLTTDTTKQQFDPTIAIGASNSVHITWIGQYDAGGNYAIRYITCVSGTWGSVVNLDITSGFNPVIDWPCIALDSSGNVYVVYTLFNGVNRNVWLAKRISGTWSTSQVSPNPISGTVDYRNPTIAVDTSNAIHIIFQDGQSGSGSGTLYYMSYKAGWSALLHLTTDYSNNALLRWSARNVPTKPQWTWAYGTLYFAEFASAQSNAVWFQLI